MKSDWNMLRIKIEIRVGGKDFQAMPNCRSADDQIRSRTLDAALTQTIVEAGSRFVVFLVQQQVWVESEIFPKLFETLGGLCPG